MKKIIKITASGNSMFPTICDGDILLIDTDNRNYEVNDIIVFLSKEDEIKLIAHRITYNYNNRIFMTKGDNNIFCDIPIRLNRIIGRVVDIYEKKDEIIQNY